MVRRSMALQKYPPAPPASHHTHSFLSMLQKTFIKRTSHREQPQILEDSLFLQATDQDNSCEVLRHNSGIPNESETSHSAVHQTPTRSSKQNQDSGAGGAAGLLSCVHTGSRAPFIWCSPLFIVIQFHGQQLSLANRLQPFNPSRLKKKFREHLQHYQNKTNK